MSENTRNATGFIGYEKLRVVAKSNETEKLYLDNYKNFGWEFEGYEPSVQDITSTTMSFKRDRKIPNKAELTKLQHQFDSGIREIEKLESSKAVHASVIAYGLGLIGAGFTVGAVFAFLGSSTALGIILAIPAAVGWVLPYFCYNRVLKSKTEKTIRVIEQKYDEIYGVCEKGHSLVCA